MAMPSSKNKVCVICGDDCSNKPRTKDTKGRYFCKRCYESRIVQNRPVGQTPHVDKRGASKRHVDQGEYGLERAAETSKHIQHQTATLASITAAECPSCGRQLSAGSVICIPCGINVKSGRAIITSEQGDTSRVYANAQSALWLASWLVAIGVCPISSEAHGARKPHAIRAIALLTILFTVWMWAYEWTGSTQMRALKNQFLWAGSAAPDYEYILACYEATPYGDQFAFEQKMEELRSTVSRSELHTAALQALPPSKRCFGEFHAWQLITHAFLHGDVLHLAGNLVFLLVFGSRINALIGNVGTLLLYPILAVLAALAQMMSMADEMPGALLGASGAIMGLAGMYLVFFPINPVHVAAWARVPVTLFRLKLALFHCRGFWILLFFIGWDILYTSLSIETGTAHWAHLGGFGAGMAIALALLLTRAVNPHGSDIITVIFGRHSWLLLGKPAQWQTSGNPEGWLARVQVLPTGAWEQVTSSIMPKR